MIRNSQFYNNPQIGAAFSSLASAFAPPSSGDVLNHTNANAKREASKRLADVFEYAKSENYDQAFADRTQVAAGLYNPNQSYHAVNLADARSGSNNAADNQRHIDVAGINNDGLMERAILGDATDRYKIDQNNINNIDVKKLDNEGAMARHRVTDGTNRYKIDENNANRIDVKKLDNAGAMERFIIEDASNRYKTDEDNKNNLAVLAAKPLTDSQALAKIIMAGSDEQKNAYRDSKGAIKVNRDQVAYRPDGSVLEGRYSPLSTDQVEAATLGGLTDAERLARLNDERNVETIVGPDGNPQFAYRSDAAGQQAYVNKGAQAKPNLLNYETPDGALGTAVYNENGGLTDTQTGEALPQGTRTYKTQVQGTADETGIGGTVANQTEYNKRLFALDKADLQIDAYEKLLNENANIAGIPAVIRGFAQDLKAGAQEFSAAYGDAPIPEGDVMALAERFGAMGDYDPTIRQFKSAALQMAYLAAGISRSDGRVSVTELERHLGDYMGGLAGNRGALASVQALRSTVQTTRQALPALLGNNAPAPTGAPTAATPPEVEQWVRGPDGRMRKAP